MGARLRRGPGLHPGTGARYHAAVPREQQDNDAGFFLPDFCGLRAVFAVVVLSELFAFVLVLADSASRADPWGSLALTSLFMQWAGLCSAALLCVTRNALARLGVYAPTASYLLLLALVAALSEGAFLLLGDVARGSGLDRGELLLRNLAIGAIVIALALRYFYVQHQWKRRLKAESEARLQALQARIRPHFLFNSMNTIASLTRSDPLAAEEAVEDMADLFRASLGDGRQLIPLAEELFLTRRYLHMEKLRLGERLAVEWSVDPAAEEVQIPPLTLQPLAENAIYHGIEPQPGGGCVTIRVQKAGGTVAIELTNPVAPPGGPSHSGGNRIALENVKQRLAAHFGDSAGLQTTLAEGRFRVQLSLPTRDMS